jgi:hypothetical protein
MQASKKEPFNLRHASPWDVIERIFDVLKQRFPILPLAPESRMDIQERIPSSI